MIVSVNEEEVDMHVVGGVYETGLSMPRCLESVFMNYPPGDCSW